MVWSRAWHGDDPPAPDARLIKHLGDVVGMDPHVGFAVDERQRAAALAGDLGPVDHDLVAVTLVEGAQGVVGEFDLVGSDVVHASSR